MMKTALLLVFAGITLNACSLALPGILSTQSASVVTPAPIPSSTKTPSNTASQSTPTFTSTPTLIGGVTLPTQANAITPMRITALAYTPPGGTLFAPPTVTPVPQNTGFSSVTTSEKIIYWGSCHPGEAKIKTKVLEPDKVFNVVIFIRLRELNTTDSTPWNKGAAMDDRGEGNYTYILDADHIEGYKNYFRAWVYYQLVATDKDGNIIGRTQVYTQNLSIAPCL
jgi:hypothetical protein